MNRRPRLLLETLRQPDGAPDEIPEVPDATQAYIEVLQAEAWHAWREYMRLKEARTQQLP